MNALSALTAEPERIISEAVDSIVSVLARTDEPAEIRVAEIEGVSLVSSDRSHR